jgi:hypothetical protein
MTFPMRFLRPVALWMASLFCLGWFPVRGAHADSFTIRCDWFDRGNVDAGSVARNYAGKYPCIVNGGVMPNTAEYDLEFPVAGEYTVHAQINTRTKPCGIRACARPCGSDTPTWLCRMTRVSWSTHSVRWRSPWARWGRTPRTPPRSSWELSRIGVKVRGRCECPS